MNASRNHTLRTDQNPELHCVICSADLLRNHDFRVTIRKHIYDFPLEENLSIQVCRNCRFRFAYPAVSSELIADFYRSNYRSSDKERQIQRDGILHLENQLTRYSRPMTRSFAQLMLLKTFREFKPHEKLLEIGSGYGTLFFLANKLLPPLQFFSVEPDIHCQDFLRLLAVESITDMFRPTELNPRLGAETFDIIVMSHVLEHYNFTEIEGVMRNVARLLSKDGHVLCEVPNCDDPFNFFSTPHLSFFTPKALRLLFEKAGFRVVFLSECGRPHDFQQKAKKLERRGAPQKPVAGFGHRMARKFKGKVAQWVSSLKNSGRDRRPETRWEIFFASDELNYGKGRHDLRLLAIPQR